MGDLVVAYSESERGGAHVISSYAQQATEIDRFFAATVKAVHGDFDQSVEGVTEIFDSLILSKRG